LTHGQKKNGETRKGRKRGRRKEGQSFGVLLSLHLRVHGNGEKRFKRGERKGEAVAARLTSKGKVGGRGRKLLPATSKEKKKSRGGEGKGVEGRGKEISGPWGTLSSKKRGRKKKGGGGMLTPSTILLLLRKGRKRERTVGTPSTSFFYSGGEEGK